MAQSNLQYGYGQSNFTPSMAIVIIVLIMVFFFLGFFSVYVPHYAGEGIAGAAPAMQVPLRIGDREVSTRQLLKSLLPRFIQRLKSIRLVKEECAVCLSEFEDDRLQGGEMPYPDFTTVNLNSPRDRPTEIAHQVEERSADLPALPADAMMVEVKPETKEERRERGEEEEEGHFFFNFTSNWKYENTYYKTEFFRLFLIKIV